MTTDPRIRTLAEARQQVGIDTGRTFAWDDLNPIEQGNALAVAAAWLEAAVAAGIAPPAAVPVPPPADQTALSLTAVERQFLAFALDLASDKMASRGDEFSDEDWAALETLRRVAAEEQPAETQATTANKAATLGLTDTEYRARSHAAAVATIRAAIPGMYAHVGFRLEDVLNEAATERPAVGEQPAVECTASISRSCLAEGQSETACDTEAGECVYGGRPAVGEQLGSPDCTCIPFTRQGGKPRYCGPTDTVDMISGWEIGRDCPHHKPAVGEQPETQEAQHLGGRANAEDCPACEGTNPPYPFLCPGPDAP